MANDPKVKRRTGPGASCKLTKQRQRTICDQLRDHNHIGHACAVAGIHHSTFCLWMARGLADRESEQKTVFSDFLSAVEQARQEWEASLLSKIKKAGEDSWTAWAWLLERTMPEKYGKRDRIDLSIIDERIERELARLAGGSQTPLLESPPGDADATIIDVDARVAEVPAHANGSANGVSKPYL